MVTPAHGEQAFAGRPAPPPRPGEKVNCDSHLAELRTAGTTPPPEKKCANMCSVQRSAPWGELFY